MPGSAAPRRDAHRHQPHGAEQTPWRTRCCPDRFLAPLGCSHLTHMPGMLLGARAPHFGYLGPLDQARRLSEGWCQCHTAKAGPVSCLMPLQDGKFALTVLVWPAQGPCSSPGCWASSTRAWSKRICLASHWQSGLSTSASHLHLFL